MRLGSGQHLGVKEPPVALKISLPEDTPAVPTHDPGPTASSPDSPTPFPSHAAVLAQGPPVHISPDLLHLQAPRGTLHKQLLGSPSPRIHWHLTAPSHPQQAMPCLLGRKSSLQTTCQPPTLCRALLTWSLSWMASEQRCPEAVSSELLEKLPEPHCHTKGFYIL